MTLPGRWFAKLSLGRRASISMMFAASIVPMAIAAAVAIDLSRLADGRSNLQRAVDNGALSGAAAYSVNAQASRTKAIVMATSAFCDATATMPAGFTLAGTATQACGGTSAAGPSVTTQIGGFQTGVPGITPSNCSAVNPVVGGSVTCGFIVTVSAQATMTMMLPAFFGMTSTISVTGIAANPFINIGTAIAAQILGSSYNTNSIWLYPVLLDGNGNPDFTTNLGAVPGLTTSVYPADASASGCTSLTSCGSTGSAAGVNCSSNPLLCTFTPTSGCTDNPLQFTCGAFTMLASTFYNTTANPCPASAPCYPNGAGSYPEFIQGVVQSPQAPSAVITATTPIGIAFESIAGGDQSYGYGGYQANPANGCYYPGNAVYTTVAQVFGNASNNISGGYPGMDWPKMTHWFYSSFLANGYPPSEGEILSQSHLLTYTPSGSPVVHYNTRIPSLGQDSSGTFLPLLLTCSLNKANGNSYDEFLTTTYPSTGATNASLFILNQPAGSAYILPANTGYAYTRYTPAGTPGYQFAALSCQQYGTNVVSFYWNDMGGSQGYGDDIDYNNGTVRIACSGSSFVLLIG